MGAFPVPRTRGPQRRQAPAWLALTVLALLLVVVSSAATVRAAPRGPREVQSAVEDESSADPYAYLNMLDEVDLKQMLNEKTAGRFDAHRLRTKADLIAAVRDLEQMEDEEALFNQRVAAAMERKAAGPQHSEGEEKAATAAGAGQNKDNKDNAKEQLKGKRVVHLMNDSETASAAPTQHAGQKRASPASAGQPATGGRRRTDGGATAAKAATHQLEVLYCTG